VIHSDRDAQGNQDGKRDNREYRQTAKQWFRDAVLYNTQLVDDKYVANESYEEREVCVVSCPEVGPAPE